MPAERRDAGDLDAQPSPTCPTCSRIPSTSSAGSRGRRAYRSILSVPMLRDGQPLGVDHRHAGVTPGPFSSRQVDLLKTFADQAVIAIENVRLFQELEARTGDLTRSVGELRALGEVGQAVSSTLDLETVLATIVSRAVQLAGSDNGIVYEFDEGSQSFHARATHQVTPEQLTALRTAPVRLGEGAVGRAGVIREPVQVADIEKDSQLVAPQTRDLHVREGTALAPRRPARARGSAPRRPCRPAARAGRLLSRGRRHAPDPRGPVGDRDPERPAVPGDRREEPGARGREPAQVAVPRQHEPRAPDAAQRHHRRHRDAPRGRAGRRPAGPDRGARAHPPRRQAPARPDQRHPGPLEDRGGQARALAGVGCPRPAGRGRGGDDPAARGEEREPGRARVPRRRSARSGPIRRVSGRRCSISPATPASSPSGERSAST